MNEIFKNETDIDQSVKDFFKGKLRSAHDRQKCDDDEIYIKALMYEYKKLRSSYRYMNIYHGFSWVLTGWIIPFYFLSTIDNRGIAVIVFFVTWIIAFNWAGSSKFEEPVLLIKAKIQAYKELLREVPIFLR